MCIILSSSGELGQLLFSVSERLSRNKMTVRGTLARRFGFTGTYTRAAASCTRLRTFSVS